MAIQKPSSTTRILVDPPILRITGPVDFDVPDTTGHLEGLSEEERFDQVRRIMELGTYAAGTISTSTTLRMVEAQVATMTQELTGALSHLLTKDRAEVHKFVKELLDDHRGRVAANLSRYLDPESQASLPVAMAKIFDQAGATFIKRVEVLLSEGDDSALGRLADRFSKELGKSTAVIVEQLASKHALVTRSALAGRPYEEDLEEKLISMARPLGDQVVRCADTLGVARRRSGDLLVNIDPAAVGGRPDLRIVAEGKRRGEAARAFSRNEISTELGNALRNRVATAGLFVTESAAQLPLGHGFHEFGSNRIAVAWDPMGDDIGLAVGYRLLRFMVVQQARGSAGDEIDLEAHRRIVANIRAALATRDAITAQHQAAINSIRRAGAAFNEMTDAVLTGLKQLDEIMGG